VAQERERREELEMYLKALVRQWELKQQQSLLVISGDDNDDDHK
jgi:hypothetical protein